MKQEKVKVIKRDEPKRIRPVVIRKLLLDEKAQLMHRVRVINKQLEQV